MWPKGLCCPSQFLRQIPTLQNRRGARSYQLKESLWAWSATGPQLCRQRWPAGGPLRGRAPPLQLLTSPGDLCTRWLTVTHKASYKQIKWKKIFHLGFKKPTRMHCPNSISSLLGKLWSRSVKLAYTLLNKLGTKNEQILKPGDRVRAEWQRMWPPDRDRMAGLTFGNILVGGLGVSQQRPRDVLGGLFWLSPGWSHTCSYWSPTISQGEKTSLHEHRYCIDIWTVQVGL